MFNPGLSKWPRHHHCHQVIVLGKEKREKQKSQGKGIIG